MTNPDDRPELPPIDRNADERSTLVEMLEYYRTVLKRKAWGLTDEQLAVTFPPSDLSLGGLLWHMAYVEDNWFVETFSGGAKVEPWASMPWDEDYDYEIHNAHRLTSDELHAQFDRSVASSRKVLDAVGPLSTLASNARDDVSMRWILVHMIEEYARHCGHADFIRESIDGAVDD